MASRKVGSDYRRATTADRLHSAAIHLLRRLREHDEVIGSGPAALSALSILAFKGPQSLCDLARMEQVKPPTMTRIIDGLERKGLAKRYAGKTDKRSVSIRCTATGSKLLWIARDRRVRDLSRRMAGLSKEQLRVLELAAGLIDRIAQ